MDSPSAPVLKTRIIEHPIVTAITSEIKGVNALSTYWRESIRSTREQEVYRFLHEVSEAIGTIIERTSKQVTVPNGIDLVHLESDEFKRTLAKVCEAVVREGDESKTDHLRSFIVNYAKEKRPDVTDRQLFFTLIDDLAGIHLVVMKYLYDHHGQFGDRELRTLQTELQRPELCSLTRISSDLSLPDRLRSLVTAMLAAKGLIHVTAAPTTGEDRSPRLILQPIGRDLMAFLAGEWK